MAETQNPSFGSWPVRRGHLDECPFTALRGQSGRQRRGVGFHPSETPAAGSRQLPRGANRRMILPPTIAGICKENG